MTPTLWNRFRTAIDPTFRARLPREDLRTRLSATEGAPLTVAQYQELRALDTDVVRVGDAQYALTRSRRGPMLNRLVRPVTPDAPKPGLRLAWSAPARP